MKLTPYEDNTLMAIEDAKDSLVITEWQWAYYLAKALIFALLYIGTSIRENKNV